LDKPNTVYVSFIASTPGKVWDLLLDTGASPDWFFGHRMEVGAEVGDPLIVLSPDGSPLVEGEVLVKEPGRRLRVSWVLPDMPIRLAEDEIEFLIEEKGEGVVRFVVHEYLSEPLPERWIVAGREGWSLVLSGIKTILEAGKPLPRVVMMPPD